MARSTLRGARALGIFQADFSCLFDTIHQAMDAAMRLVKDLLTATVYTRARWKGSGKKFHQLPPPILSQIATGLCSSREPRQSILDLLPLRLVHPAFTSHMTKSIFCECEVQGDIRGQSGQSNRVMNLKPFLLLMKLPRMRQHIRRLVINLHQEESLDTKPATIAQLVWSLVCMVAETVQVLYIAPGNLPWMSLRPTEFDTTLPCLQALNLDKVHLPLLYGILAISPHLKVLRITGQPHWTGAYIERYKSLFLAWEQQKLQPKALELLELTHATDHRALRVLKRIAVLPKTIELSIEPRSTWGLHSLVEGAAMPWRVFSEAASVKLSFSDPGQERLDDVTGAICAAGLEVDSKQSVNGGVVLGIKRSVLNQKSVAIVACPICDR